MRRGVPLDDTDRGPWIRALVEAIDELRLGNKDGVLACSLLRAAHRDVFTEGRPDVRIVHLVVSPEVARTRVARRKGHYMRAELVDSQFTALEPPEDAVSVDASATRDVVVGRIRTALGF